MSEELNEVHIKTYDEWLKYYKNATKEQVIEDLTQDVQYFADAVKDIKDLQQKVEQLEKEIDRLNNKVSELENINEKIGLALNSAENKVDRLNNIINELEKYIHNELVLDFYNDDMPCELIINKMEKMIKELKENNNGK